MIDYDRILCDRIKSTKPSGIRKYFDIAATLDDVISLGVGEPDFHTPWVVRQEAVKALDAGKTTYTANSGLKELRQEITNYLKKKINTSYDPENEIIVTVGGSEAIDLAIRCMVDPGDEVLICEPSFVCYKPITELVGGKAVIIETKAEDDFRLTADALKEKITDRTKLLILPFPNNPTGAIMSREDLEGIAKVLEGTNIAIISDEIYSELTYGQKHCSPVQVGDLKERTIIVDGFSKAFAMTGWRLGFLAGPEPLIRQMLKLHQYAIMSSPTISQYAAIKALKDCEKDVLKMREEYDHRRRYLVDAFNKLGLDCFTPKGAFYVFPCIKSTGLTSEEFCNELIYKKRVAVVPGNAFGDCGEGFIRVSYAYSLKHLKEAIRRISEFIDDLKKD
ncbi:MAG: aminotransferase class I/II-fold pyridoxal phosphate-dependent enzyme [Ruminococcus sp.]|nr:aminotransferase class I/II-fold pyridoxal phosphate-dependent enzyme [Ruminococcus sp.]